MGGVSQVSVIGGEAKEYQIRLKPELMQARNVSIDEVADAVPASTTMLRAAWYMTMATNI